MKYSVVLIFALLGVATAFVNPIREDENGDEDRKYMLIPDEEGNIHLVNLQAPEEPEPFFNVERDVIINLFTRRNPTVGQRINMNDMITLRNSNFNANHPTRFIVHGWNNKGESSVNINIRNSYHSQGDFNVFVVDWSAGSTLYYPTAARRVQDVGPFLARYIDFIVDNTQISTRSIHMTGHSLGAHIVGVAGRRVTRGRIHTITGMDPALPWFSLSRPDERIDPRSAEFVEIFHTNGGLLGFSSPLGHADFYPNGGRSQPGCILDVSGACAHARAHQFFAEAITSSAGFWSWNCRDYHELMRGTCTVINSMVPMGVQNGITSNHGRASGIFYLRTNSRSPFAQGRPSGWDSLDVVVVDELQKE